MTYPDVPNPDLLDRIPLDAQAVIDVGCDKGALGAEYKRRNPKVRYIGVEFDAEAARIAQGRLDAVFVADLDAEPVPFGEQVMPGSVDCIIYGDVLEHLRDPWGIVRAHAAFLSERGVVLICMPNMEHWSFAERLLRGYWDYDEQGLFDRTHIRWFAQETTRRMLQRAGLIPVDVIPRIFDREAADAFADAIEPGLRLLGVDVPNFRERIAPLQHVWRAQPDPVQPLRVVSSMLSPIGGVSHVRVLEPMQALAADPTLKTEILAPGEPEPAEDGEPGIFVFHRPLLAGEAGLARVRRLVSRGWLVTCEFDDHPDHIPVLQRPDVHNFRAVHAVQTSTEPLAQVLRRDNPEVMVFPNAVARLPDVLNFRAPGRMSMLFAGLNREKEWPPYLDALNAAARKVGDRLHIIVVSDRGHYDALDTPHKSFVPLCGYDTYQRLLASCEISFMPLQDTPFNRCKSDLKFIEAAASRVVPLASETVYRESIEDGRTGVLFRSPEDLEHRLIRLVAHPDMARGIGDAARDYVRQRRMLAYQVARRVDWYHGLWARRDELQRALLHRVPELRD
jgi:glycosyltransferase involved in cell wall biosynthesis